MNLEYFDRSFLLDQFREFYAAVLAYKREVEERNLRDSQGSAGASLNGDDEVEVNVEDIEPDGTVVGGASAAEPVRLMAERIRGELFTLLQKQVQAVLRRGDEREQRRFREIQYVMAATADEVFLNLPWEGRDYWTQNLLEEELFHSHNAGEQFFRNVEDLLRNRDPTKAEVMGAYLIALSLGFRGKYRDITGEERLSYFRMQLFATLFQRNPGLGEDTHLFPQAYANTQTGKPSQWLPRLRPWLMAIGGVFVGYLALSHLVWATESSRVETALERIIETRKDRAMRENRQKIRAADAKSDSKTPGAQPDPDKGAAKGSSAP